VPTTTWAPWARLSAWGRIGLPPQGEHLDVLLEAGEAADLLAHLLGQLAGRAQHHRLHREVARVEALQQRQAEGGGLAAAGLGLGDEVVAGQRHRQAGGLDRRHLVVAEAGQVGQHRGGQAELFEGRGHDGGGRRDEGGVGRRVRRRGGVEVMPDYPQPGRAAATLLRGGPPALQLAPPHCSRSRARRCWMRASSSACSRRLGFLLLALPVGLLLVHRLLAAQLVGDLVGVVLALAEGPFAGVFFLLLRLLLAPFFFLRRFSSRCSTELAFELGDLLVGEVAVGLAALGVHHPLLGLEGRVAAGHLAEGKHRKKICRMRPTIISADHAEHDAQRRALGGFQPRSPAAGPPAAAPRRRAGRQARGRRRRRLGQGLGGCQAGVVGGRRPGSERVHQAPLMAWMRWSASAPTGRGCHSGNDAPGACGRRGCRPRSPWGQAEHVVEGGGGVHR
jgi:hypothetical protein